MQALVASGDGTERVTLDEVREPQPGFSEAMVEQRVISLNRGEARALRASQPGAVFGWDVAGVVARPAADGSGPPIGSAVIGVVEGGGWAQRVAVASRNLAVIPEGLDIAQASVLPIAGLTALWALSAGGTLLGRRVLITGAAGGVGRLAVQLAHQGGASVSAIVGRPDRAMGLQELGASEVIMRNDPDGDRFDLILESVGGASLAASLRRVAEGGTVVLFGNSSDANPSFDVEFYNRSRGARLLAFNIMYELQRREVTRDLTWLAGRMHAGCLDAQISLRTTWRKANTALQALTRREVAGKAVLHVD
jgi:NADPH:quinone reductase-like Zn-dependent oxidoreductase